MRRNSRTQTSSSKHKKIFRPQDNPSDSITSNLLPFCYFHTQNRITKFCQCKQCTLPLCRECQLIHVEEHQKNYTRPQIQDYIVVREKAANELQLKLSNFQKDLQRNRKVLMQEKTRIQNLVHEYFRSLLQRVNQSESSKVAVGILDEKLQKIRRGSIKALIQHYSEDQIPTLASPIFEIANNDQGLLCWLKNTINLKNVQIIHNQKQNIEPQQQIKYQHSYPQKVSVPTSIIPEPLNQNLIMINPNIVQTPLPIVYNKNAEIGFQNQVLVHHNSHRQHPSILKVQNSKENHQRSESPTMPSTQKFKSRNVLRNSCEITSPIKQLHILGVTSQNQTFDHQQKVSTVQPKFNPPGERFSQTGERFNQTFTSNNDKRFTSSVGFRPPAQTVIINEGNSFNPLIHQRSPPQFVTQQNFSRPQSSHSVENTFVHNIYPQTIISQQPIIRQQIKKPAISPVTISQQPIQTQNKILTPAQLQSMIINKKAPQIEVRASFESKPSLFARAASNQRINNFIETTSQQNISQGGSNDFWKAESYFSKQQSLKNNAGFGQGGYQINIIQAPKVEYSNGFMSTGDSSPFQRQNTLKLQDLMSRQMV